MMAPTAIRDAKLTPRISSAPFWSFWPIFMAQVGAPPIPTSLVKAVMQVIKGRDTLKAAMAVTPSSILPINIRSTILYKIPTSCAIMEGMDSDTIRCQIFFCSIILAYIPFTMSAGHIKIPLLQWYPQVNFSSRKSRFGYFKAAWNLYVLLFVSSVHGEGIHIVVL